MGESRIPEQPSTPQQAEEVFTQIGELTALQGKQLSDRFTFGEIPIAVPDAIAEHFPDVESDSHSAGRTLYVRQMLDHQTGQPLRKGVVGMVSFIQKERRDEDLGYSTSIGYHVVSDGEDGYSLERHVTSREFGKAKATTSLVQMAITNTPEVLEQLVHDLKALRDRDEEARKVEAELGVTVVSTQEAQQVFEVLSALNVNK
jgi:hypothetical protein